MLACFIIALQLSQASSVASLKVTCIYSGAFATGFSLMVTPPMNPGKGTRKYELDMIIIISVINPLYIDGTCTPHCSQSFSTMTPFNATPISAVFDSLDKDRRFG